MLTLTKSSKKLANKKGGWGAAMPYYSFALNFGLTLLIPTMIGLGTGLLLDNKLHNIKPTLTLLLVIIGAIFGTLAGVRLVIKTIKL